MTLVGWYYTTVFGCPIPICCLYIEFFWLTAYIYFKRRPISDICFSTGLKQTVPSDMTQFQKLNKQISRRPTMDSDDDGNKITIEAIAFQKVFLEVR